MGWEGAYVVAAAATCSLSAAWFVWQAAALRRDVERYAARDGRRLELAEHNVRELWTSMLETVRLVDGRLQRLEKSSCERRSSCETTGRDGPASTS